MPQQNDKQEEVQQTGPGGNGMFSRLVPLFLTAASLSATANSGYAILAGMKVDLVEKRKWLTEEQMADVAGLAQSAPGPISTNASMIIGYQSAGIPGGIAAVLGTIFPAITIMLIVSVTYQAIISNQWLAVFMRGMQIAVVALLMDVIISLFQNVTKEGIVYPLVLGIISFLYVRLSGMSVAYLAIACAVAGVAKSFLIKETVDAAGNGSNKEGGE